MESAVAEEQRELVDKEEDSSIQGWMTSSSAWGSSWLRSAKEKTFSTFELVRKDLTEFGDVVANEACALASTTVESFRNQAQNLQQIMSFEEEEEEKAKEIESSTNEANQESSSNYALEWTPKLPSISVITNSPWVKTIVDTVKNIAEENTTENEDEFTESIYPRTKCTRNSELPHHVLYGIQVNPDTYMKMPEGDEELFKMWCDDFRLNEYDGEINALLTNCPQLRALYQELVPTKIENTLFWERYFYKVHQAELIARCKMDAEKQLLHTVGGITNQTDFEKKCSCGTDISNVDTDGTQGQSSPDRRSTITGESWSLCSSTNVDIQELHDELVEGPQTPKADSANVSDKSDGWVNWDE